jgi:carbon storage regulator
MLVLSRKAEERILIGDSIVVQVLGIQGDKVKLGFEAPRELKIRREELEGRDTIPLRAAESDGPPTAA